MHSKVYLAPLAGITDAAMREVCIECGADLTFTEMVSAKGLQYNNAKTKELLNLSPLEKRVGVQVSLAVTRIFWPRRRAVCAIGWESGFPRST